MRKNTEVNIMTTSIKSIGVGLFGVFAIWYFLRRTTLGGAFSSDLWSIPEYFTDFVGMRQTQEKPQRTPSFVYRR